MTKRSIASSLKRDNLDFGAGRTALTKSASYMVLGGVTRQIFQEMTVPVLMSH